MKIKKWYVADFETTSDEFYNKYGYTKVWLYAISDENGNIVNYGETIDEFFKWLHNNPNIEVYFHNLRFDGSFILNYLLSNKFKYQEELKVKDNRGFTTLIGEEGQYYQIKINFARKKQVKIYDSLKIIPLKVKEIAEAFNLEIGKGKINYNEYIVNEKTLDYVFRDVKIVAKALKFFKDMGFNKMTIGSNAYNLFKQQEPYFKDMFPILPKQFLEDYREAYRGGRTQVNPTYQDMILHNIKRFDINSMYPYAMSRFPMPYGLPFKLKERGKFKFELYKIDISFKLKEGHLPTLLKSSSMFNTKGDTYYINSDGIERLYISNIDFELLERHYDITFINFIEMYGFKTSSFIFREWIDKYYELKNTSTGGMKLLWKLIINNLYGKFGSRNKGKNKIPKYVDETLTFELSDEKDMQDYYLPVAIAITSHCHKLLDDMIMLIGYDNFVYCDTDSIHCFVDLPSEYVDNKEIGKFKMEGIETTAKYIRQKCYAYKEGEEYHITCSGMNDSLKDYLIREYGDDIFNVFRVGLKLNSESPNITRDDMKLRPKQVKGGTILVPTEFSLN